MFNGIIKNTGKVVKFTKGKKGFFIGIKSNFNFSKKQIGTSISCSGTCLTLTNIRKKIIFFYISTETLSKTNFKNIKIGDLINLEKPLKYGEPISGHFVQGHIDTTAKILKIDIIGKSWFVDFKLKKIHRQYIVEKGSITVNGVSLTISKILKEGFQTVIIPHTLKLTNLIYLKKNNIVNIEYDILFKYFKKISK